MISFDSTTVDPRAIPRFEEKPVAESSSPRILVVDDDEAIRELLGDLLHSEGYGVLEATNGVEAVESARRHRPMAVLMDLMMPRMTGAEATAALKSDPVTAVIPVLAMSANRNIVEYGSDIPADAFITKPFDLVTLMDAIAHLTKGAEG